MDEVIEFVVDVIYEFLPPGVATALMTAIGAVIGFAGKVWHSHEQVKVALCNSSSGRFTQLFNGSSQVDCGAASLLSKVAVVVEVLGFLVALGFGIGFAVLAAKGKLGRKPKPGAARA